MTDPTVDQSPDVNLAAVLFGPHDIRMEERAKPRTKPDEVVVRVEAVGICGSDVHYFRDGRIGSFEVRAPLILGHEASGTIVEVGLDVDKKRVGERVAIEPGIPCGRCLQCHRGTYNLCPDVEFLATPPVDGAFQRYVAVRADFVFPMPEGMTFEQGALVEPTAVALWACHKAGIGPGSRVLVTGAGPVGLLALQVARARGASRVTVTDVDPSKIEMAKQLGADDAWMNDEHNPGEQCFDAHLECSGSLDAASESIRLLDRGGISVLVGMGGSEPLGMDVSEIQERELQITGTFRYANCYPAAIELIASGRVQSERLVTARFGLAETADALRRTGAAGALKTIVKPQE